MTDQRFGWSLKSQVSEVVDKPYLIAFVVVIGTGGMLFYENFYGGGHCYWDDHRDGLR